MSTNNNNSAAFSDDGKFSTLAHKGYGVTSDHEENIDVGMRPTNLQQEGLSTHVDTGEPLPKELCQLLQRDRNPMFQGGVGSFERDTGNVHANLCCILDGHEPLPFRHARMRRLRCSLRIAIRTQRSTFARSTAGSARASCTGSQARTRNSCAGSSPRSRQGGTTVH